MITRLLIIANIIAFGWEFYVGGSSVLSGGAGMQSVLQDGSLYPAAVLQNHEWWRIVTGAFLHDGVLHIGVNMFSLWIIGRFVESALGSPRMLFIYAASLVISGLGVVYFSPALTPTIGASGAIFGLFGSFFAIGFKLGPRGMAMVKANVGILVINLIITFTVPNISWQAHIAGLLAGFLITFAVYFPPKPVRAVVVDAATGQRLESEIETPHR